jgi:hypothetical protein
MDLVKLSSASPLFLTKFSELENFLTISNIFSDYSQDAVGQQGIASGYPANIPGAARRSYRRSSQTTGVWLQHLWSLSVSGLPPIKHAGGQLRQQESSGFSICGLCR